MVIIRHIWGAEVSIRLSYSDVEVFPYQMGEGGKIAAPPGIAVEIIQAAARDIDAKIVLSRYPNKRVQTLLKSGMIDGAFVFSYKDSRKEMGQYPLINGKLDSSRRIAVMSYYFYVTTNSPVSWNGKALINTSQQVGANMGYSIVGDLRKIGIVVEEAMNTEQNLRKLVSGRISAYAAQDFTADVSLKTLGIKQVKKLQPPIKTKDYFLIFSHQFVGDHPNLAKQLWTSVGKHRDQVTEASSHKYFSASK